MKVCWRKMAAFSEVSPIDFIFHFRKYTITNSYIVKGKGWWGGQNCQHSKAAVKPNMVSV